MERERSVPRAHWQSEVESVGLSFHTDAGLPYWDEAACYAFTNSEIDHIEDATNALHALCLEAVDRLIVAGDLARLSIPERFWSWLAASWRRRDPALFGRFDLAYDGTGPAKMLEYNADTPTTLLEAAVVQWHWLESVKPTADQFNSIHERLIDGWRAIDAKLDPRRVHFAGTLDEPEDFVTVEYLRDVCQQAGLGTEPIDIAQIGWNGQDFTDLTEQPIRALFKLYPWEWLLTEDFSPHLLADRTRFIEPPWKMVLSNKAILPILWEMFPGHPNLLPASFERAKLVGACVEKPIHGREGGGIRLLSADDGGQAGDERIWQARCPLPIFEGRHVLIGSWVIRDAAAGIGIREDFGPITGNASRFVPHYIR